MIDPVIRYSIGLSLDDMVKDVDFEKQVFDNLRRCKRLLKTKFKVLFYHENLSKKDIESFVVRNKEILFELSTEITADYKKCWFLVDEKNRQGVRYRFQGGILNGIVQFLELIKQLEKMGRE
tara:strand:+ start:189 stop:554 length:366 start_codon:yes stop_codon:yes gene_type:complete